jgi:tetratricopeptide (TPR) repeat protein
MELREPPRSEPKPVVDRLGRGLLVVNLLAVAALAALLALRGPASAGKDPQAAERARQVASQLKAAGALDEAAALYARYLESSEAPAEARAKVAYSLGTTYLEQGRAAEALRWFYEAESLAGDGLGGDLDHELGQKIVHALERLGRHQAARAALGQRANLDTEAVRRSAGDPVVAKIGARQVHRSDVERALDDLPPDLARMWSDPSRRPAFLRQYVADELLWQKAQRLEYDRDPEVLRREEAMRKRLAVATYLEREVLGEIKADEADLRTWFEAHRDRYQTPGDDGKEPRPLTFEEARPRLEQDYRLFKAQSAYEEAVAAELAGGDVELFEEEWADG